MSIKSSRVMLRCLLKGRHFARGSIARITMARMNSSFSSGAQEKTEHTSKKLMGNVKKDPLKAKFVFPEKFSLPLTMAAEDGTRIRLENLQPDRVDQAYDILKNAIAAGEGYTIEDLPSHEEFITGAKTERGYFQLIHEKDNDLFSFLQLIDCPISRACQTINFAGPIVVNPKYRSMGLGRDVVYRSYLELGRVIMGFPGFPHGRTVIGKSLNALAASGSTFSAILPNSIYLEGKGWTSDLIVSAINPKIISGGLKHLPPPTLNPLVKTDPVPSFMQSPKPILTEFPEFKLNGHNLKVVNATPTDIWRVEDILRLSAMESDGFTIDEFNPEGHYNRKFLFDSHVIVAKTNDDVIIATSILGPNKLARSYNPKQLGGFIHINKDFRRKGLGNAFLKYLMKLAKYNGVKNILTDVLDTNFEGMMLLRKNHFTNTGSLAHTGYQTDYGYVDSFIFHKTL